MRLCVFLLIFDGNVDRMGELVASLPHSLATITLMVQQVLHISDFLLSCRRVVGLTASKYSKCQHIPSILLLLSAALSL